jgi:hypothetical protein
MHMILYLSQLIISHPIESSWRKLPQDFGKPCAMLLIQDLDSKLKEFKKIADIVKSHTKDKTQPKAKARKAPKA